MPNGFHLLHGVDSYKQLLRQNNEYLASVGALAVEGITEEAMAYEFTIGGEKK